MSYLFPFVPFSHSLCSVPVSCSVQQGLGCAQGLGCVVSPWVVLGSPGVVWGFARLQGWRQSGEGAPRDFSVVTPRGLVGGVARHYLQMLEVGAVRS